MFKKEDLNDFQMFDPAKDSESMITNASGIYAILLRHDSHMPTELHYDPTIIDYHGENYELIYVGISKTGLYNRDYTNHFNGTAGKSTLRKSIGSLMGLKKTYRSEREKVKQSGIKTKFVEEDEKKLSEWMKKNLLLLFKPATDIENTEESMIEVLNPILNIQKNRNSVNKDFRDTLSSLRNDLSDLKK